MNRKLAKLLKKLEDDDIKTREITDYLKHTMNNNIFKFLYDHSNIFCACFCFNVNPYKRNNKHTYKVDWWCRDKEIKEIRVGDCNCTCKDYTIYEFEYKCIPSLYNLINCNLVLNLGISL